MRNLTLFLVVLLSTTVMFWTSCSKNNSEPLNRTPGSADFDYEIVGLRDTSLERIGEVRFLVNVNRIDGDPEMVNLTAIDLPEGMDVTFTPSNGEPASYVTSVLVKTTRTKEGTYTIKIRGASPTAGVKDYPVKVTILPYSNDAVGLKGDFTETGSCVQQGNVTNNIVVTVVDSVKNRVLLKGLSSGVQTNEVYADLSPDTKTITIPSQVQSFVTYQGSGSYQDDVIQITYTINGPAVNETCTTSINRK